MWRTQTLATGKYVFNYFELIEGKYKVMLHYWGPRLFNKPSWTVDIKDIEQDNKISIDQFGSNSASECKKWAERRIKELNGK